MLFLIVIGCVALLSLYLWCSLRARSTKEKAMRAGPESRPSVIENESG